MFLIRRILFIAVSAVYLVVCPLIILYALGYIYNPVKQQFVQTGLIRLSTMPSGADVFFEKSHYQKTTPATISGVLSGEYRITLKKKGYRQWSHAVNVEPGKAAAFENIILIPEQWPTAQMSELQYDRLIPLSNRHLFLVSSGTDLGNFYIYSKNRQLQPLIDPESPLMQFVVANVHTQQESDLLVFEGGSFWNRKYLYANLKNIPADFNDITELFENKPDFIKWDSFVPERLYAAESGCIHLIDIDLRQNYPCYLEDVKGFGFRNKNVFILDTNDTFWRMSLNKKREILSSDMHLAKQLFNDSDFYEIIVGQNDAKLFLGIEGQFITEHPPYRISDKGVTGFEFGPDKNLLLFWSKNSVSLADFSVQNQTGIFQSGFTVQKVHDNANNIRRCLWAYKNSHILCLDTDSLYLIELEPQGPPHIEFVTKVLQGSDIMCSAPTGYIYYLEENSGRLKECRIIQ